MLDPARHFLTVKQINASIDAMAQNKMNALHLHLTDGESFTPNTESWPNFPKLSVSPSPALRRIGVGYFPLGTLSSLPLLLSALPQPSVRVCVSLPAASRAPLLLESLPWYS